MISSFLSVLAVLTGHSAETVKPNVDRSGEEAFRAMLTEIAGKKNYHGMILRSVRDSGKQDFYPDGLVEVWRDGDKFRVDFGDMWGTSIVVISDGKKVLEDVGADPVVLKKPGKNWTETSETLKSEGSASSPWHYLVEGEDLLKRLDKDRSITPGSKPNSIVWDSTLFGKVTITKERSGKEMEVWEIEFDNMPRQEEEYKESPEWFNPPDPAARWRQRIVLVPNTTFPKQLFETKPGRGKLLVDLTIPGSKLTEEQEESRERAMKRDDH